MQTYDYCARCRRSLSKKDLEEGLVLQTEEGLVCDRCIREQDVARSDEEEPARREAANALAESDSVEAPSAEEEAREWPAGSAAESDVEEERGEQAGEPLEILEQIRRDVRAISRALTFEKASGWNVLGGVTQCFALGAVLIAFISWGGAGRDLLLLAVFLQVMALTFLVMGK